MKKMSRTKKETSKKETVDNKLGSIDVLFVAGFGPITRDPKMSRELYADALGISFKDEGLSLIHISEPTRP